MRFILILILLTSKVYSQNIYFPPINNTSWDTVSFAELNWCEEELDTLIKYVGENDTKAFIVLKNGKIAIEKYYGTFSKDSFWYWASAGKSLTATLVGLAQENNFLNIQDTSSKYLGTGWTNCSIASEGKIKIVHQLSMNTGLNDVVQDKDCTLPSCLNCLTEPGQRWAYYNGPYTLLDKVIENSTGLNMNQFANAYLKNKIGMTGLYVKQGYNNVYFSSARSMARFGLLSMNNFIWNNDTILKEQQYKNAMINSSQNLNLSYGYLWWLNGKSNYMLPGAQFVFNGPLFPDAPSDMFSALGKNGQVINVVPSEGIVMIRMGNPPLNGDELPMIFNNEMWKLMKNIMCVSTAVNKEKLKVNIYPNPAGSIVNIDLQRNIDKIIIYNSIGNKISEIINPENSISISDLESGIYFMQIFSNDQIYSSSFIKKIE